ncbi:MAG: two-component regulator propeller domain-containing protein, partial [Bacteroidota bacterium]
FRQTGFYSLVAGEWTAYNRNNTTALAELFDFYTILTNTATNEVYAGSFLDGLVVFDGTNFTVYDDSNSSLNNAIGDENRTRVSGLALDATGNLWISNHAAERPFSVRTTTGDWQSFSTSRCAGNDANLLEVLVDDNGYKWFTSNTSSVGLLVYDTGVLEDNSDDRCRVFTSTNSALPNNTVKDIVVDQDGDVWVGTSEGVVVFQCGPQVFDNCDATEITTDQDETNLGRLLSGNEVSAVAIDGGNNKWFGTTNSGIFVQSPDGREQLAHFNINNSPLLSNTITDISIRDKTGEVFIGTSEGLMSYRAQATSGGVVNSNNIYAFPNPVRPEYDGDIAITGLAQNADVKITDVNGQLIYETRAQGGQAIWDGNDYNGRRASTGVYLVFSTNNNLNNPDAAVAKILFIH